MLLYQTIYGDVVSQDVKLFGGETTRHFPPPSAKRLSLCDSCIR
jgi:hypothetical protein